MYDPKRKFERPVKRRWSLFLDGYERVSSCGWDSLCRQGKARFRIVAFLGWPWTGGVAPMFGSREWLKYPPKPTWTACNPLVTVFQPQGAAQKDSCQCPPRSPS